MNWRRWPRATALIGLVLCAGIRSILGAECSADEEATILEVQEKVSNNTVCPINQEASSFAEYCSIPACVSLMEEVIAELPDCESFGLNMRDILVSEFYCGSSSASIGASGTGDWGESDSECTSDEIQQINTTMSSLDQVTACKGTTESTWAITSSSMGWDFCAAVSAACVDALKTLAADLPDCITDGVNTKSFIDSLLAVCDSDASQGSSSARKSTSIAGFQALVLGTAAATLVVL